MAMIAMARRIEGIAINPSITRIRIASATRRYPATRPIARPAVVARSATLNPMVSEIRPP